MKRVFLYGLAGAEDRYKIVRYVWFECEGVEDIIEHIRREAAWLKFQNPSVEQVYGICESARLANAYKYTKRNDSIEANVTFKLMLETEGIPVIR